MDRLYDVIIVGAGPVGLFLACELGLAGTSVLVLERDTKLESPFKDEPLGFRGMNTTSVEALYRRDLLGEFVDLSKRPSALPKTTGYHYGGHFAGIGLNANKLELERWKYRIPGPGLIPTATNIQQVETILYKRAETLGVRVLRGYEVQKLIIENDKSVSVEAGEANLVFRSKWLVGCDGARSAIRKAAGFTYEGTEAKFTAYAIQCDLDHPEKLKTGFNPTKGGMYIRISGNGLHLIDFDGGAFDRTQGITVEHLQEVLNRVTGVTGLKIEKVYFASSYTDRCMQATTYRKGRILLAGDAAHIHSPLGAQGMNLGLADAFNLGWKLAATVRQENTNNQRELDLTLLDTYEAERHPVAVWALDWTRAQVSILQPGAFGMAVRNLVSDFIDTDDGMNMLLGRFWGLSQRYDLENDSQTRHPLVGQSVPDFEFNDGSRLGNIMADGRGLVIDFQSNETLKEWTEAKYGPRVNYVNLIAKDTRGLGAIIVRPDGITAWAIDDSEILEIDAAKSALKKWFEF
ncbi:Anhydrotetracycline monooxygenase [Talaromyces pinophilus]|nr:Anhydrotetracycline monooxygenase [Talaromyces pinophilus]